MIRRLGLGRQSDLGYLPRGKRNLRSSDALLRPGGKRIDGSNPTAVDCEFAIWNRRKIPGISPVESRAGLSRGQIPRLLCFLPKLEQLDKARREVGPELSACL